MEARVEGEALWIICRNPNLRTTVFAAGELINLGGVLPKLRYGVQWKGKPQGLIDRSTPGVIAGRLNPWIITLPHGAEYHQRTWLRELAALEHPLDRGRW